jgi:hypothetical protein
MMMIIQRKYTVKHDTVRAVVIEHVANIPNAPHKIKAVMSKNSSPTVLMEPFDYHRASTWTKI